MTSRVNYDDNIFFVHTMIKSLRAGLTLDVDPELFKDKALEDIFFVDSTLMKILSRLRDSPNLIRRAEYLKAMLRAENTFLVFLGDVLAAERPLAESLGPFSHKIRACRASHQTTFTEIQTMLHRPEEHAPEEDVVSREELNFLLQDDQQSDESDG
ncbi:MAG: hypothetical protein ACLFPO_05270 [Spirochaetaceae bacterium]